MFCCYWVGGCVIFGCEFFFYFVMFDQVLDCVFVFVMDYDQCFCVVCCIECGKNFVIVQLKFFVGYEDFE